MLLYKHWYDDMKYKSNHTMKGLY